MDEPPLADYPRSLSQERIPPRLYAKDSRLAFYVMLASGIGLLQHGFHALGFSVVLGSGQQVGAIVFTVLYGFRLAGGIGLIMSRRWAFFAVLIPSLLILALVGPTTLRSTSVLSYLWLLFSFYLVVYSAIRLIGREGPKPV